MPGPRHSQYPTRATFPGSRRKVAARMQETGAAMQRAPIGAGQSVPDSIAAPSSSSSPALTGAGAPSCAIASARPA